MSATASMVCLCTRTEIDRDLRMRVAFVTAVASFCFGNVFCAAHVQASPRQVRGGLIDG